MGHVSILLAPALASASFQQGHLSKSPCSNRHQEGGKAELQNKYALTTIVLTLFLEVLNEVGLASELANQFRHVVLVDTIVCAKLHRS